ncbi:transporter [Zobellia uliginosa]|uniref:transporter n=1 Tax=Zobellia uliginosa TaxID=143224 RepID=UPI0026E4275E|nr:transporter [Zobellia uliginosa]MDO6517193.1 transporter [Zobellia uliginosa]
MTNDLLNTRNLCRFFTLVCIGFYTGLSYSNDNPNIDGPTPSGCATHIHYDGEYFDFCDTCGCGSSGGSMGYGTGLNNNFFGLRYIGQEYRSRDGIFADSPWITENFNTIQAWANLPIGKRIIANVIVPFQFHNRSLPDNSEQTISGLGDISVLGFYNLIAATPDSIVSIKPEHYFQLGGGIKMPTGKYDKDNNEGSVNPSFQLGNGSWDYVLAMNYGFTYRNWGISTMANYTIKTKNPKDYQFGNQLNLGINAFKTYYISDVALTPIVGVSEEIYASNRELGIEVAHTKGDVFLGKLSIEASYNRYSLGLTGMLPISQNLNDDKVELRNRVSVYMNINL